MSDVDDLYDDWYDNDDVPVREEPVCYACGDSGYVGRRNCGDCNPTRWQALWWRLTWRFRWWRIRAWLHRPASSDEAPF